MRSSSVSVIAPYYYSVHKRFFDVVISTTVFIALLPLMILLSVLILITAGWPLIFTQYRTGLHKQPFLMFKFRTMYSGAEKDQYRFKRLNEAPPPMFKAADDPRFVGIGRFLSHTGLDELPQLWHIIKGDMSLVGPRPLPVYEANKLDSSWDFRYRVRPGVFSQWSGSEEKYNSLEKWKSLEKATFKKGSIWTDLYLIITITKKHFLHRWLTDSK